MQANKRASQWQHNGRLSRGTQAYPGANGEQDGVAKGEGREIIGAVDETFLAQMLLVFQEVSTGYI